jgi:DNA-binding Xre family transcriptional regulator
VYIGSNMIRLNINSYLEQQNITAYRLIKESGLAPNTVYTLARTPAKRIDLDTLESIVKALTRLTGQPVTPNDLLEVIDEPEPLEPEAETRAWMDNSVSDMAARLADIEKDVPPEQQAAWLEANHKAAKPVKYVAGQGFVEATR